MAGGLSKMLTRIAVGLFMGGIVLSIIFLAGHHALSVGVFLVEAAVFRELLNVRYVEAKERDIPWFRSIHWGLLVCCVTQILYLASEVRQHSLT